MRKKNAIAAAAPSTHPSPTVAPACGECKPNGKPVTEQAIRVRAYQKWEAAGKPGGDGVSFWIEAEQELSQAP